MEPFRQNLQRNRALRFEPVPFVEWDEVYRKLSGPEGFLQGEHVTIIGPTGGGKTHIALEVAEIRKYVLFIACKPEDPLIDDLQSHGYFLINKMEIPYVQDRQSKKIIPAYNRVVYWPRLSSDHVSRLKPDKVLYEEKKMQRPAVQSAIGYVRKNKHWCLILDESTWICRDLMLQRDVDSALFTFRTLNASIILCMQRPKWAGQYALSQPTHLFLFQTAHKDDAKALGDITGVNHDEVVYNVARLDHSRHEVLYVNTRTHEMMRTIAPPR